MSTHPYEGAAGTNCRQKSEFFCRLRLKYPNDLSASPHLRAWHSLGRKEDTLCSSPRCRSPSSSEGFPKGRAAARPFVSFQGGAGGNRNPPAFLFRGLGGHSLFKREYPPGFSVPNRYSSAGNPGNLFGKTKRKWGFNPVRHSRTSPYQSGAFDVSKENVGCILRGKAALPAANRRLSTDHPGSAAYSCTGGRPGPGSARRWGWRGCGCPPPPRSGW